MMGRGPGGMGFGPEYCLCSLMKPNKAIGKLWQEKNFQLKKEQVQLMAKSGYLTEANKPLPG